MFGIDWLGMLNAAMGMRALGLLNPSDISNMTEKEVDTVATFLKEKKKEGHFRAMWKAYGELVNLMASEEVWIADAWWPVIVEVSGKGIPVHYAVAKEGYRAWCNGYGISAETKNLDACYEWLNYWMEGYPGRAPVGDRLLLDRQQLREIPRSQAGEGGLWRRGPRRRLARRSRRARLRLEHPAQEPRILYGEMERIPGCLS